jgi:hypothetical protein
MTPQDVSQPVAGFFRFRLRGGGVICGVEIRFGPPLDPVTGEELDRAPRWMAFVNGDYFDDWNRIWPGCTGSPISEAEYRALVARRDWARQHAPESAYADPHRRIDPLSTATPTQF